jgi:hypothetical protein
MDDLIVARAVRDIMGMTHFYSQNTELCRGALQAAANQLGHQLGDSEADALAPKLRVALNQVMEMQNG